MLVGDSHVPALHTRQLGDVARGASDLLAEFGLEMIMATAPPNGGIPLCLRRGHVKGVLFRWHSDIAPALADVLSAIPCVDFFTQEISAERDGVLMDTQANALMAIDYLAQKGCERLIILNPDESNSSHHLTAQAALHEGKTRGWEVELYQIPKAKSLSTVFPSTIDPARKTGLFIAGYTDENRPEVVAEALQQAGLTPARGVEVIAMTSKTAGVFHACCYNSMSRLGRICAEQLVWRIGHPGAETRRILVKPKLVTEGHASRCGQKQPDGSAANKLAVE